MLIKVMETVKNTIQGNYANENLSIYPLIREVQPLVLESPELQYHRKSYLDAVFENSNHQMF